MKLNLMTATVLGGTVGAYTILLGGIGVAVVVRNVFGPANESHDDLSTWMVFWRIPLGAFIGSSVGAYLSKQWNAVSFFSLVAWIIFTTFLSTFIIFPISLVVVAFVLQTFFKMLSTN